MERIDSGSSRGWDEIKRYRPYRGDRKATPCKTNSERGEGILERRRTKSWYDIYIQSVDGEKVDMDNSMDWGNTARVPRRGWREVQQVTGSMRREVGYNEDLWS